MALAGGKTGGITPFGTASASVEDGECGKIRSPRYTPGGVQEVADDSADYLDTEMVHTARAEQKSQPIDDVRLITVGSISVSGGVYTVAPIVNCVGTTCERMSTFRRSL